MAALPWPKADHRLNAGFRLRPGGLWQDAGIPLPGPAAARPVPIADKRIYAVSVDDLPDVAAFDPPFAASGRRLGDGEPKPAMSWFSRGLQCQGCEISPV